MLLWDTFFDAGEAQLKKSKYGKAEQLLKSALGEANSFDLHDPRLLKTLLALISVYQESKRPKEAEPHLKRAEELIDSPGGLEPEAQARVVEAQLKQLTFEEEDPQAHTILRERMGRRLGKSRCRLSPELLRFPIGPGRIGQKER